jgi:two-component system, OmpR family, response regulator RegX3
MQVSSAPLSLYPASHVLMMTTQTAFAAHLRQLLEDQSFAVDQQFEQFSSLFELSMHLYDLILIGPSRDPDVARQLCTEVRRRTVTPLILLTEDYQVDQQLQALKQGVDRVIPLPCNTQALLAHSIALLRRSAWARNQAQTQLLTVGPISLCPRTHVVKVNQRPLALSPLDYRLLHYLMQHVNRPVSKMELRRKLWADPENTGGNQVEVAIRRLRNKIEDYPSKPQYLVTQPGVGYKLQAA